MLILRGFEVRAHMLNTSEERSQNIDGCSKMFTKTCEYSGSNISVHSSDARGRRSESAYTEMTYTFANASVVSFFSLKHTRDHGEGGSPKACKG